MARQNNNYSRPNRKPRKTVAERERDKMLWQLDKLRQALSYGYSHENFKYAAHLYQEVGSKLDLYEYNLLGDAFRGAYADDGYMHRLDDAVTLIKDRIFGNGLTNTSR